MSRYDTTPPTKATLDFMRAPPEVRWVSDREDVEASAEAPEGAALVPWRSGTELRDCAPRLAGLVLRARRLPAALTVRRDISYPVGERYRPRHSSLDWLLADAWGRPILVTTLHWGDGGVSEQVKRFRDADKAAADAHEGARNAWDAARLRGEHAARHLLAGEEPSPEVCALLGVSDDSQELLEHYWGRVAKHLRGGHGHLSLLLMNAPPPRDSRVFGDILHHGDHRSCVTVERARTRAGDEWVKLSTWRPPRSGYRNRCEADGFALTDAGRRRENQDVARFDTDLGEAAVKAGASALALVADGMGGEADGGAASATAVDTFVKVLEEGLERIAATEATDGQALSPEGAGAALKSACDAANAAVYALGRDDGGARMMGTTLTAAVLIDDCAVWVHVGDSRLYRWRGGEPWWREEERLTCRTEDHGNRYGLWMAVGPERAIAADVDWLPDVRGDDILLLCSDGLTNMLADEDIDRIISRNRGNLQAAAEALVRQANEAGGDDNISVVLMRATPRAKG